jgi:hypothetical protein
MATNRTPLSRVTAGTILKENATGSGAIAASLTAIRGAQLASVSIALDAAPVTSEFLTVTLDAVAGAAYDSLLYRLDPASVAAFSIIVTADDFGDVWLSPGDAVTVAHPNTDAATYGVEIVAMEAG